MNQKASAIVTCVLGLACAPMALPAEKEERVYELRTYYAAEGKLDELHARFRDHTCKLFEKHGMTNIGYWVPVDNKENKLIYMVAFPSVAAQKKSWGAFGKDPEWQKAYKESERNGKLVSRLESVTLSAADYSPPIKSAKEDERVFEMRTYTAVPGRLDNLNARFRDHTIKLFEKHGITNVGYWLPIDNKSNKLIYMLAHKSVEAAKASFDAFRMDPDWVSAKKESEEKAGGSLTVEGGVKSVFLKATDYSPMK